MATECGNKLNPYRQLRKAKGIKFVRRTIRNSHIPSHVDQNEILTVLFPDLEKNDVIVPGTSRLPFKANLSSTGGNANGNRTIVNNLGRAIIRKLEVKLEGQSVFTLDDADVFMCYQDLWKTTKERKK